MRLLLDTHTFMWMDNAAHKLPANVQQLCLNPDNELLLSVVSVWEMQIKIQLGKLTLRTSLEKVIIDQERRMALLFFPLTCRTFWLCKVYLLIIKTLSTGCSSAKRRLRV